MRNLRRCLILSSTWLQKRRKYCAADTSALITTSHMRARPKRLSDGCLAATITIATAHTCRTILGLRSEEHTSELQSRRELVCRLLLEKKKQLTLESQPH